VRTRLLHSWPCHGSTTAILAGAPTVSGTYAVRIRPDDTAGNFFLALAFGFAAPSATIFEVAIDTSPVSATGGGIYLQFNPGLGASDAAQARVSNFLLAAPGAVSGVLPGAVVLANTNALNDYFHGLTSSDGLSNLFTSSDPDGYLFRLDLDPTGIGSRPNFNPDSVNFDAAVPEPSSLLPVGSALGLVIGVWRRRSLRTR